MDQTNNSRPSSGLVTGRPAGRQRLRPYLEGKRDWEDLFRLKVVMTPLSWDPEGNFKKPIEVPLKSGKTAVSRLSLKRMFEPESDPVADLTIYRTMEENLSRPFEEKVRLWQAAHLNFQHDTIFMLKHLYMWLTDDEIERVILAARHGLIKFVGSASPLGVTVMLTPQLFGRWNSIRHYCRREWHFQITHGSMAADHHPTHNRTGHL